MKYNAAITSFLAIAFVVALGISSEASAARPGDAQSVLVSRLQAQPQLADPLPADPLPAAPSLELDQASMPPAMPVPDASTMSPAIDGSTAPAMIEPPVVAHPAGGAPALAPVAVPAHQHHGHVHYHKVKKKQNFFQKLMEMERKKNAWLRKTFLGK